MVKIRGYKVSNLNDIVFSFKQEMSYFTDVPLPISILIILAASLCCINSHDGNFVFDDSEAIVNNKDVQSAPLLSIFENDFWGTKLSHKKSHKSYRPLTTLTFRFQYWLRGYLNAQDFHIVNITLHIIVSVLMLFVLNIILGRNNRKVSFYAAALFAAHPVHAEAVSGIVGRADLLCALFFWLSILFYNQCIFNTGMVWKSCSLCCCISCIAVAMFCKETGITAIGLCVILWIILGTFLMYTFSSSRSNDSRYVIMGFTFLIVPFLPASNIFFRVGFVIAERTLYIPSAGYCLLFAIGLEKLSNRWSSPKIFVSMYAMLILLFFTRSWVRSNEWKTETVLFNSAIRVCPLNAKVHYNVAKSAADLGNSTHAELEYKTALRLNPNYTQAMNNLGNLLKDRQQYIEAEKLFRRAVKLQEDFAAAWMNLGIVLSALKKHEEAEKCYLTALSHRTKYPDCYYNLGVLYLEVKRFGEALSAWKNATLQKEAHRRAWTNIVLLLDDLGRSREALSVANHALKIIPEDASMYFNIANILGKEGNFLDAEKYFKSAIARNPNNPMFYTNLGVLYHRWGKFDEANKMYNKALQINPNLQGAKENLRKLNSIRL
ncbi:transmembrane and TPR repeat-containing protein 4 isoform X2 [Orussus abietinus]|uniref:transmembrane and TPR repeat-containing protein 4 isoform X2 n=1 Tax=Orussus abietinus TaxID=222816 RepID=UPI0006264ED6|nr:transmembrane and TPR repeat-containing protein 4 isoform X2 [Orussus abietinus]